MRYIAAPACLALLGGCFHDSGPDEGIVCYDWNTWYLDEDGDGHGVEDQMRCACSQPEAWTESAVVDVVFQDLLGCR